LKVPYYDAKKDEEKSAVSQENLIIGQMLDEKTRE
jgi:hypothetical protein